MESNKLENTGRKKSKAASPKSRSAKAKFSRVNGTSSPGKNPFSSKGKNGKAKSGKSVNKPNKSDIDADLEQSDDDTRKDTQNESGDASNTPLSSPFPGGWETLLPTDNRKPLPEIPERKGRRCILEDTVNFYPAIYQQFISLLGSGVSINVACTCVGWNESTFHNWAYKGACDERDGKDTYFSRLHKDVRRAIASKTADCERSIAEQSPANWLAKGPGRIFGGPWSKPDPNKRLPSGAAPGSNVLSLSGPDSGNDPTEVLDASFIVQPNTSNEEGELDGSEDGGDSQQSSVQGGGQVSVRKGAGTQQVSSLSLTPQQELEALEVWESIGLIKLDPALRQAFDEQSTNQGQDTTTTELSKEA